MMMLMLVPKLQGRGPPATEHKGALRQDAAADGVTVPHLFLRPASLSFGRSEVLQTRNWDMEDEIKWEHM